MPAFVRTKKVTDPLDDKARARLFGARDAVVHASSGSEHSPYGTVDDYPCLSELVHGFLEDDEFRTDSASNESDSERVDSAGDCTEVIENSLKRYVSGNADSYRNLLCFEVAKAMELFSSLGSDKPLFRRKTMSYLRENGHNAAICKSKWDSSGGLTAGNYEFIDVAVETPSSSSRYFIDLAFASEFEVARPTDRYSRLLKILPRVFVGNGEDLKRIVKLMSDEAKRSLKRTGLSMPPWRKNRYMQSKWFGPYRRTTNPLPVNSLPPKNAVNCRWVGFDNDVEGRHSVRTR